MGMPQIVDPYRRNVGGLRIPQSPRTEREGGNAVENALIVGRIPQAGKHVPHDGHKERRKENPAFPLLRLWRLDDVFPKKPLIGLCDRQGFPVEVDGGSANNSPRRMPV